MRKLIQAIAATAILGAGMVPAAEAFQLSITPQASSVSLGDSFTVTVTASEPDRGWRAVSGRVRPRLSSSIRRCSRSRASPSGRAWM